MAKYHRKVKISARFPLHIDGEEFSVEIEKLNTPDLLGVERAGKRMISQLGEDRSFTPDAHKTLIDILADIIVAVYDLKDEDDQDVSWSDLNAEEKRDLLSYVYFLDMLTLYERITTIGRLEEDEKKV